jgi:nicotinate-nucleotide adenylyltransferase
MGPIGIFGGTFDPIHHGHLRTALELLQRLSLAQVLFVPSARQPLRDPSVAPVSTRLAMVRAAVREEPRLAVDTRELERPGPSYTVDTLESLRGDHAHRSLCLLLGMDAFLSLPRWHRWEELTGLANVVVAHRPGWQPPGQGALALVCRKDDQATISLLQTIQDGHARAEAEAERALSRILESGCRFPVAACATHDGHVIRMRAAAYMAGGGAIRAESAGTNPITVGEEAGRILLESGAASFALKWRQSLEGWR